MTGLLSLIDSYNYISTQQAEIASYIGTEFNANAQRAQSTYSRQNWEYMLKVVRDTGATVMRTNEMLMAYKQGIIDLAKFQEDMK